MASIARDLRHVLAVAFPRPESDADLLTRFVATLMNRPSPRSFAGMDRLCCGSAGVS